LGCVLSIEVLDDCEAELVVEAHACEFVCRLYFGNTCCELGNLMLLPNVASVHSELHILKCLGEVGEDVLNAWAADLVQSGIGESWTALVVEDDACGLVAVSQWYSSAGGLWREVGQVVQGLSAWYTIDELASDAKELPRVVAGEQASALLNT
jgi:hypothetical protein